MLLMNKGRQVYMTGSVCTFVLKNMRQYYKGFHMNVSFKSNKKIYKYKIFNVQLAMAVLIDNKVFVLYCKVLL